MTKTVASLVRTAAGSDKDYWIAKIKDTFGIICHPKEQDYPLDPIILRQVYQILKDMKPELVKDCGIKRLFISYTMGPNLPFYPSHGYFINDLVTLNVDIFIHPDVSPDFFDYHGYFLDRPTQTIIHEFAHGYDAYHGELSEKEDWMKLSGWSKDPKLGLKRLLIQEKGMPPVIGEMYYDPRSDFTRFYARRNPWDDWADSFSFYVGGLKDKVPATKRAYFDKLLAKYAA